MVLNNIIYWSQLHDPSSNSFQNYYFFNIRIRVFFGCVCNFIKIDDSIVGEIRFESHEYLLKISGSASYKALG